jgi:LDH2 family malate/lactate/ureidoglycolate dehydrogenase
MNQQQRSLSNLSVGWLTDAVTGIFSALGFTGAAARSVAESLVEADLRGIGSHGVLLVPMYVQRIRAGSVSRAEVAEVVRDKGAVAVLDGRHALGQLTGDQAMRLAVEKARTYGVGAVTVRHAFHFGGAFRYAAHAARNGCVGIAAANTRPLMPAPGGASAVVGNNPLAIAVPRSDGEPVILDIALSEAALGKIRLAAGEGREIPPTWATDEHGRPTTDPAAALRGLLLPSGGHKGYGLAFMVDVLTGVLSGGAFGRRVNGLYADLTVPNDCAHFFLALDTEFFGEADEIARRVSELGDQVLGSDRAPGVEQLYLPGDIEAGRHARALRRGVALEPSVFAQLVEVAAELGVPLGEPETVG